ncbi:hypothetical protein RDWZM_006318 [Blomia tropicalis]|uniref:Fatty acid desaturase domain-containing protein n=1 Tax=Blomia tropicalis TaxID=40697 RepID=A0A9Q0RN96_BLOTA|nr:hypothetical protein RDWZM_006318 [Blomia tropicalis]
MVIPKNEPREDDPAVYHSTTTTSIEIDSVNAKQCSIDLNGNRFNDTTTKPSDDEVPFALFDVDIQVDHIVESDPEKVYKWNIVWSNVVQILLLHIIAIGGFAFVPTANDYSLIFSYIIIIITMIGVQSGAHRLWTHRSYKANAFLRFILCLCQTIAGQTNIYRWVRDHRVHHKWSETDADPHNSNRGFFFSHVGWLLVKKCPEVYEKGRTIDMSDITADKIVMFQKRFYYPLLIIFWGILPTFIPVLLWNEIVFTSFIVCMMQPYFFTLHTTWMVNSWAHMFGGKPYNTKIGPVEATIRHMMVGEGFHNYHHTYPWDYSASELGASKVFNLATMFINFFAWIGWATELKKVDPETIRKRIQKTGDLSAQYSPNHWLREWVGGLLVSLSPLYIPFLVKYGYLYFAGCLHQQCEPRFSWSYMDYRLFEMY